MATQALAWKSQALFAAQDSDNSSISTGDVIETRDSVIESLIAVASSKLDIEIRLQVRNAFYDMRKAQSNCTLHKVTAAKLDRSKVTDERISGRHCNI